MTAPPPPDVSVCVITYNHAPYIADCLRSVLAQTFPGTLEIVVGEDCSTDRTRSIIRDIADQHPGRFSLQFPDRNLGMGTNLRQTYAQCRGRYVALLEGDDLWTDPLKLQRQVAALEAHSHWSGCFHPVPKISREGVLLGEPHPSSQQLEWTFAELCRTNPVRTCSMLLRREAFPEVPAWMQNWPVLDWPIFLMATLWGPLGLLEQEMAAYRIHPGGVWSGKSQGYCTRSSLNVARELREHLPAPQQQEFTAIRLEVVSEMAIHLADQVDVLRMTSMERLRERLASWRRRFEKLFHRDATNRQ